MSKKYILGTKQDMTQVFDENGVVHAATVVSAGPVVVTQVKTSEKDGYTAVQVGFGEKAEKNLNKPALGHFKGLGNFRHVREFADVTGVERGATLDVSQFSIGDIVTVSGISKGKGWQGVVKRHGFAGDMKTHGRKHTLRMPGSLGGGGRAGGRVAKGKRMGGRMGSDRVTVQNLRIIQIDKATNTLVITGAIPGNRGGLVEIISN
ncbi:MAG: 50S ribosomal protein L3 [Minisyncoccia bacterium]